MKFLGVSTLFSVALAASIPTKTERAVTNILTNAERMAAGMPINKPRNLYSPGHVHVPRASAYPPTGSDYTLYGCVNTAYYGTGYNNGAYTTMEAAEATCSANTQAQGYNLLIQQDSNDNPTNYYCVATPGTIVACSDTSYVYYTYTNP